MADKPARRQAADRSTVEWVEAITWAAAVLLLVFTFCVRVVHVDGDSMLPTLHNGERLLISSVPYTPHHGDIVVTDRFTPYGKVLIKRVIGCPGDTIDIDFSSGTVLRNGTPLEEPYTAAPTLLAEGVAFPLTVPQGCVFVMGDNRNESLDSRSAEVGFIDVRDVLGKALWRLTPLSRMGAVA